MSGLTRSAAWNFVELPLFPAVESDSTDQPNCPCSSFGASCATCRPNQAPTGNRHPHHDSLLPKPVPFHLLPWPGLNPAPFRSADL